MSKNSGQDGNATRHLPGIIVTESAGGKMRYLLADGLGPVRQSVDETGAVVTYNDYDPYGNPLVTRHSSLITQYGFTGEWWQDNLDLLYLRARWYAPETGTFLSVDPVESQPPYAYVGGNVVNRVDPSGYFPPIPQRNPSKPFIGVYQNSNLDRNQWVNGPCSDWTGRGVQGWLGKQVCLKAFYGNEWAMEQIFRRLAGIEMDRGWTEAARSLNHFLDGTGTNLFFPVNWLFASAKETTLKKNDKDYYLELRKRIRNDAVAKRNSAFYLSHFDSTPLTERAWAAHNKRNLGINTPLGDQQLTLGARTLNVDVVKEGCDGLITADYYIFEYYDFRKDTQNTYSDPTTGIIGDNLGYFNDPTNGTFTMPTQWLDQLVISGKAKEYWTIVAWRERYKLKGMGLVSMEPRKDYTGPFPSPGYPASAPYPR